MGKADDRDIFSDTVKPVVKGLDWKVKVAIAVVAVCVVFAVIKFFAG